MSITRPKVSLLFLTLASCSHNSPDAAVLAPLAAQFAQEPVDQSKQPEYLIFGDDLTAGVFKSLRRDPRYRVLPTGKPFVCPSDGTPCPKPYQLRARVNSIMGDSAIATIERTHADGVEPIVYREQILLLRRNGTWKVERVLGYSAVMPM
jgi:hypothetical protein